MTRHSDEKTARDNYDRAQARVLALRAAPWDPEEHKAAHAQLAEATTEWERFTGPPATEPLH